MDQNLPKAVQAELAKAEAIQQQLSGQAAQPETPVQTEAQQAQPDTQQQQEEKPAETQPVAPAVTQDAWEQKYQTLYGKYSAEVPRLYDHVKLLTGQLQAAMQQIEDMKRQMTPAAAQQAAQAAKLVTEDDEQAFGADLVDMIRRGAREEAQNVVSAREAKLLEHVAALESRLASLTKSQGATLREQYDAKLDQLVPDWKKVDADQRWLQWLAETDPLAGAQRQALLDESYQKMDVMRTAAIFDAFKKSVGWSQPQPLQQQTRRELERQVAPQTSRADVAQMQGQKKFWTTSEIQRFYDDVRRRRYSDSEAARIESEINAAIAEGRIT
jgi:hypothetical protein